MKPTLTPNPATLQRIVANFSGNIRRTTVNGREYLVAPLTMIVPGILHGSQGPLLYREEDIKQNVAAWNGVPLTVQHPSMNGGPISARAKGVWERQGIGTVKNASYKGKLVAEGWFDAKRTRRISPETYNALVSNQPIELSTGLFTKNLPVKNGAYKGRRYTHIATNFRPDHLAILPDRKGACSIKDGCGVLINKIDPKRARLQVLVNDWQKWDKEHKESGFYDSKKTPSPVNDVETAKWVLRWRPSDHPEYKAAQEFMRKQPERSSASTLDREEPAHKAFAAKFDSIPEASKVSELLNHTKKHGTSSHTMGLISKLSKLQRQEFTKHMVGVHNTRLRQIVNDWGKWDQEHGGTDSDMQHRFGGDGGLEPAHPLASKAFSASETANAKGTRTAHMTAALAHDAAYKATKNPIHLQQATAHRGIVESLPKSRSIISRAEGGVTGAYHGSLKGTALGALGGAIEGYNLGKRLGPKGAIAGALVQGTHRAVQGFKAGGAIGGAYGALHNQKVKKLKRICTEHSCTVQ